MCRWSAPLYGWLAQASGAKRGPLPSQRGIREIYELMLDALARLLCPQVRL